MSCCSRTQVKGSLSHHADLDLTSYYWQTHQTHVDSLDKYDPTKPYYEQYKLDFDQFKTLFLALSPWATGNFAEILALRTFRVSIM